MDNNKDFWNRFRQRCPQAPEDAPQAFHFCDNQTDADECANLVVSGQKQATAASLAEMEINGYQISEPGDYWIVTNYDGRPRAVIQTRSVEVKALGDADDQFAWDEGEGDRSLAWWKKAHLAYFRRVLKGTDVPVDDSLAIAFERFDTLYTEG